MKASELRIGNWLMWDDPSHEQFQVETIDYQEPNYFINGGLFDDMLPIPITEEWLLESEFTKIGDQLLSNVFRFKKERFIQYQCRIVNSEVIYFGILTYDGNGEIDGVVNFVWSIKYVHQLQNLFFALTGEELK